MNGITPVPEWDIYDSSKIQHYLDCPRAFFYKHILGWTRDMEIANDLAFGRAWHEAMEVIYKEGFSMEAVEKAYNEAFLPSYRESFPAETDGLFGAKTPTNAYTALCEYIMEPSIRRDLDLFDVIDTEISGLVPVNEEQSMVYKLDLLYRRRDNGMFGVLEHKTKKNSFSRTWTDQWDQSIQIGTYNHALNLIVGNEEFSNVEGVTVNGAAFLKTKFDFLRVQVKRPVDMMHEWLWTVNDLIDNIKMDIEFLEECSEDDVIMRAFRKNPQACTKYYGCEFSAFCSAWPNPIQSCHTAPPGYKVEFWNPLTEEATKNNKRRDLKYREY
jgi:hypothetical protein